MVGFGRGPYIDALSLNAAPGVSGFSREDG
jgi:hypothetical protein